MNTHAKTVILLLRLGLGWLFFYTGITKVLTANWSAAGYLMSAKTFAGYYQWLASPTNIGWVSFLNEWGLTLIGISLILGVFVRWSSLAGAVMMIMYYFPVLEFPYIGKTSFLVDEHILYALIFVLLFASHAGTYWGLDSILQKLGYKRLV